MTTASIVEALAQDATLTSEPMDIRYYSGRYLSTICARCRETRVELRDIPVSPAIVIVEGFEGDRNWPTQPLGLVEHHNLASAFLHCQLCGAEIPGPSGFQGPVIKRVK